MNPNCRNVVSPLVLQGISELRLRSTNFLVTGGNAPHIFFNVKKWGQCLWEFAGIILGQLLSLQTRLSSVERIPIGPHVCCLMSWPHHLPKGFKNLLGFVICCRQSTLTFTAAWETQLAATSTDTATCRARAATLCTMSSRSATSLPSRTLHLGAATATVATSTPSGAS